MGIEPHEYRYVVQTRRMIREVAAFFGLEAEAWKSDSVWFAEGERKYDMSPHVPFEIAAGMVHESLPLLELVVDEYTRRLTESERGFWERFDWDAVYRAEELRYQAFEQRSFTEWMELQSDGG